MKLAITILIAGLITLICWAWLDLTIIQLVLVFFSPWLLAFGSVAVVYVVDKLIQFVYWVKEKYNQLEIAFQIRKSNKILKDGI
jgi:uncharacterized membrane-anchored protein YitT (DUF2179 family)